jgi:hypothetical protein
VAAPRQRLEDLFLEIVERARADKASTSGAQAGGPTAAFLRGDESQGTGLIEELAAAPAAAPTLAVPVAPAAPAAPAVPAADRAVLEDLVSGKPPAPAAAPAPRTATPGAPKGVDQSVIDDLLGGGGGS